MAIFRDKYGKKIGYTTNEGHRTVIRDKNGRGLGQYRHGDNSTRDMNGRKTSTGNSLSSFLKW